MGKEIVKIKRESNGSIDIETVEDMNMWELFNITKDMVAIVTELMLSDLDEITYQKYKKELKNILSLAIDEGYIERR